MLTETVIRQEDAPRFGGEGTAVTGYASPSRGSETVCLWRVVLQPGADSPVHELTSAEAFLVLSGRAMFEFDGRRHELGPGDAISVPPTIAFRLANESDQPFEAVCGMAAGGQAIVGGAEPFSPPWAV